MNSEIFRSGIANYNELLKWSDLFCQHTEEGVWYVIDDDSLYRYIKELEQILINGSVHDINTLRELRLDLLNLREKFVKMTLEYLNNKERGQA